MINRIGYNNALLFLLPGFFIMVSCRSPEEKPQEKAPLTTLPMEKVDLETLDDFRSPAENWSIAGGVLSDYLTEDLGEIEEGTGVLINRPADEARGHLFSEWEHGDIELKGEILVPKGSNSGLYFQGRYEIQIYDSWKVDEEDLTFFDMGGIFERGAKGMADTIPEYSGMAPEVNASLAPGLWQDFHVRFRAPRFDQHGTKTEHARFEWVELNGKRIHENVEVTGPTRAAAFEDETGQAPLMIQGDHGPVAFRNLSYKLYDDRPYIELGEMDFTVYDYSGNRTPELQAFDTLTVIDQGTTSGFDVSELGSKERNYAVRFRGEMAVPVSGKYLFETQLDQGGNLYIGDQLVVENNGETPGRRVASMVDLDEGTHRFELTYFRFRKAEALVFYEGPQIEKRSLGANSPPEQEPSPEPLPVNVGPDEPGIIAGFAEYNGEKRSHTISVGHPEGVHYTYDLQYGMLLQFWRGPFADVRQMWQGRGHEQLLVPLNAAVEESAGPALPGADGYPAGSGSRAEPDPHGGIRQIQLDENDEPVFLSEKGDVRIRDEIRPAGGGDDLRRRLRFTSPAPRRDAAARIAESEKIEEVSEGLYRVADRYYLQIVTTDGETPLLRERDGMKSLLVPVLRSTSESEIQYHLIW